MYDIVCKLVFVHRIKQQEAIFASPYVQEGSVQLPVSERMSAEVDDGLGEHETLAPIEGARISKSKRELFALNGPARRRRGELERNVRDAVDFIVMQQMDFNEASMQSHYLYARVMHQIFVDGEIT